MDISFRAELRALLEEAGAVAMSYFGRVVPEHKPDGTPVTDADRAIEERIVESDRARLSGESVRSEEGHRIEGRPGAPCWFVDPIDGTGAFVSELAYWGPTLCRVVDGQLQVGAMLIPRLKSTGTPNTAAGPGGTRSGWPRSSRPRSGGTTYCSSRRDFIDGSRFPGQARSARSDRVLHTWPTWRQEGGWQRSFRSGRCGTSAVAPCSSGK